MGTEPEPKDADQREGITVVREGVTFASADWPIDIRPNGTVTYDGIAIGGLEFTDFDADDDADPVQHARLTLNLGWMRAAGLHVTIEGDPRVDRQRGGLVLER